MINNIANIKKVFVFKFVWMVLTFVLVIIGAYVNDINKILLLFTICTNLMIIISLRNIQPALIMGMFTISYMLYLIPYYWGGAVISGHQQYYIASLYNKVLGIHSIFLSSLYFALSSKINEKGLLIRDLVKPRENKIIFIVLYFLMLLIVLTVKGDSVLESGSSYGTYVDNLEKQGGSLEYFYILYISAFFFTKSQKLRYSLIFIVVIYCYMCATRGYRIQLVQVVFLSFILYLDGKFKTAYILILSLVGFVISEILGVMKTTGTASIEELIKLYNNSSGIIITNQTDVIYSSVVFIGLVQDGILSMPLRALSTLGFLLNCILPSTYIWKEGRLPSFALQYTSLGGGGLISVYFYIWFGYIGVITVGCMLAKFINMIYKEAKITLFKIVGILLLSTYPRWFAYDPGNFLIRLPLYLFLFYLLLIAIHNTMIKDKIRRYNISS